MSTQHITGPTAFKSFLSSNTFVLVDFYADWCPPCKMISPVVNALAQSHSVEGKLAFANVNVDVDQVIALEQGISAMPTFVLYKDGDPAKVVRGANPPALQAMVRWAEGELIKLAKEEAKEGSQKTEEEQSTVSGGYSMAKGLRNDWKMSLSG